ncbi:MAG TPA: response regulator [Nitrospirota bacterium]
MNGQNPLDLSVLYVEDDASARDEIAVFLKRRVTKLVTAENGEEGLARFRENRPDLVVTDILMPVMNGLKMARLMREMHRGVLLIVTTAHSDVGNMLEAIDIGVDQYVLKPVDSGKLFAAVEKCAEIIEYRRAKKRFLEEREKLIADLQKALAEIKTLQGILPICSFCKKIRDDKEVWTRLENYISEHTDAQFSHSVCPDCARKMYPKYFPEKDEKAGPGDR